MGIIEWLKANWTYICAALAGIVFVSSVIVGLTPTQKDDNVLKKIIDFLDHFSVFKKKEDQELIERAKTMIKPEDKAKA